MNTLEKLQHILETEPPIFRVEIGRIYKEAGREYGADLCTNELIDGEECIRYTAFGDGNTIIEVIDDLYNDWCKRKATEEAA